MTRWSLQTRGISTLSATDADRAAAEALSGVLTVRRLAGDRVEVRAKEKAGVLQSGHLRVEIRPRHISPATLISLAARYERVTEHALDVGAPEGEDLLALLARAFLIRMEALFKHGLRMDYTDRRGPVDTLRGEVDLDRWFGPASPEGATRPPCRYRERTLDTVEHRILAWTLTTLAGSEALEASQRRRAAAQAALLPPSPARPTARDLASARRTGLHGAYAAPLDLAALIAQGMQTDGAGDTAGLGYLLEPDRLLERWLSTFLEGHLPDGWRVRPQVRFHLDHQDPDLERYADTVITDPTGRWAAVLDAKNKDLTGLRPERDDIHQMIAYMATRRCADGYVVGIGPPEPSVREQTYALHGGLGTLTAVCIPGGPTLADMERAAGRWLAPHLARWVGPP